MKEYRSVKNRLEESRQVFNRILNEQKKGFDKSGAGKGMPDSMAGFPGQCCDGQGNVVPVTFASANDDCTDISMIEPLADGTCPIQVEPLDDLGLDDFHTHGDDNNQAMISCVRCNNGYPVSVAQVPVGQPCPPGTQDAHLGDPCDGQSTNLCDNEFTLNGNAAMMAGFPNSFVNNNPSNFLTNMENGYNQFGCPFLQARLNNHQNQLNNNIFFGPNNPQGYPNPGPLWVAQKQSKVVYLTAVLNGPCCNPTGTGTGPVDVGPTMG